jgi:hypothetical protein
MATTPVHVLAPSGLTLTLKVFAEGSDTELHSSSMTEETNRLGLYVASVTEALAGLHYGIVLTGAGDLITNGVLDLQDDTDIYRMGDPTDSFEDVQDLVSRQVVYEEGAIWIDTNNGSAGAVDFVNGTSRNPVDNIADANTLAVSLGFTQFKVAPLSVITFAATQASQNFFATNAIIALGGQNINFSQFIGAVISGVSTGAANFDKCMVGTSTIGPSKLSECGIMGVVTCASAGNFFFDQCFGSTADPVIDMGAAVGNTSLFLQGYKGELEIRNLGQTGTDVVNFSGDGHLILASSCVGGTVNIRGNVNFTNNGSGVTVNQDARFELSRILADAVAFNGADIALIVADTNELQVDWVDGGRLDLIIDAILVDTGTTLDTKINDMQGATFSTATDSLEAIRDRGDVAWITSTLTAANVWTYGVRTLTDMPNTITIVSPVIGTTITFVRGDTISVTLTGLGDITSNLDLWFTAKVDKNDLDSAALIKISTGVGLEIINRAAAATAANGAITVLDATNGDITITLASIESAKVSDGGFYDVQVKKADSSIQTLTRGVFRMDLDITRDTGVAVSSPSSSPSTSPSSSPSTSASSSPSTSPSSSPSTSPSAT